MTGKCCKLRSGPARRLGGVLLFMLATFGCRLNADIAPQVSVPRCERPPIIDGTIDEGEWKQAAAITGFVRMGNHRLDVRQPVVFLTCDDKKLYLAFKLPIYPPGAQLIAKKTVRDEINYGDDIIDVILNPDQYGHDRHYQFVGNSQDVVLWDTSPEGIGIMAQAEWDGQWEFKNRVTKDLWEAELAIPFEELDQKNGVPADGTQWLAHFTRAWGALEAGSPAQWTTLSPNRITETTAEALLRFDCTTGARLVFDSKAPAVRLLSVDPLLKGKFGFQGEIVNGGAETDLQIEARVVAVATSNEAIASKVLTVHLKPGETYPFAVDEAAKLAAENVFYFKVSSPKTGHIYSEAEFTFLKTPVPPVFPKEVRQSFNFEARYQPSYQRLWVDSIDFSRVPEKDRVKKIRLTVVGMNVRVGQTVFTRDLPVSGERTRNVEVPLPGGLPEEGSYDLVCSLLGPDDKTLVSEKVPLPWNKFPFVGCQAGLSNAIIAPYTALKAEGDRVSILGREYTLNGLALFSQMTVAQSEPTVGSATETLLAQPMTLYRQDGKNREAIKSFGKLKLVARDDQQATFEGEGRFSDVQVRIRNTIEYDGFAWIEMELAPQKPAQIAGLAVDIPLREDQATLLHEVAENIRRGYSGVVPAGDGLVWDSLRTKNKAALGNFKPLYWLGNEDRGLCWFGESDRGWWLDDRKPAIEILRQSGQVILRLNLINQPLLLKKPCKIAFGFQATPVKPLPTHWRSWIYPYERPDCSGNLSRLKNLKRFTFEQLYLCLPEFTPYPLQPDWEAVRNAISNYASENRTLFVYQEAGVASTQVGTAPEFGIYRGEWAKAHGHGTASYRDFRAWALSSILKRGGLHAFYDDNAYLAPTVDPSFGYGYTREDGRTQSEFLIRPLRALLKREALIYQEAGMPNYTAVHKSTAMLPPCYAFTTFAIDGEVRFMDTPARDYVDNFPLDYIRAHIIGRQFGLVPMFLSEIKLDDKLHHEAILRGARSELALLLLHEIPIWPAYGMDQKSLVTTYELLNEFDIGANDVVYRPYWEKNRLIDTPQAEVKASAWVRKGKAIVVVVNLGEENEARVKMDFAKLGFTPKTIRNYESKAVLTPQDGEIRLKIPRHNYQLLWIE